MTKPSTAHTHRRKARSSSVSCTMRVFFALMVAADVVAHRFSCFRQQHARAFKTRARSSHTHTHISHMNTHTRGISSPPSAHFSGDRLANSIAARALFVSRVHTFPFGSRFFGTSVFPQRSTAECHSKVNLQSTYIHYVCRISLASASASALTFVSHPHQWRIINPWVIACLCANWMLWKREHVHSSSYPVLTTNTAQHQHERQHQFCAQECIEIIAMQHTVSTVWRTYSIQIVKLPLIGKWLEFVLVN